MKTEKEKLTITRDILLCIAAGVFIVDNIVLLAALISTFLY